MFQTCGNRRCSSKAVALITFHGSLCKHAIGIGIFSVAFSHTPPSWISADIYHWRECPVYTTHSALLSRNPASLLHQCRVPTASLSQWNRENRTKTMNGIIAEQNRNAQARILHGMTLHPISQLWISSKIYQRTNLCRDVFHLYTLIILYIVGTQCILIELQDLFF